MRLRIILKAATYFALSAFLLASCNSGNSEYDVENASSDGQIISFKVSGSAATNIDSVAYSMDNTVFAINSEGGVFRIFNPDSLPMHTKVGTLLVTLAYSSYPYKIDFVYKDANGTDSIPENSWDTTDSVKFIQYDGIEGYYPRLNVTAPNQKDVRHYIIDFNVHRSDPDSIRWEQVEGLSLPKTGENKTIKNEDGTQFCSLTKVGSEVFFYTGNISETASWGDPQKTNLPGNAIVKSLTSVGNYFIVTTETGVLYTAEATNPMNWTKYEENKIPAILGVLPKLDATQSIEDLLVVYEKADGNNVFAKINVEDANNPVELSLKGLQDNSLPADFPVKDFSSVTDANYLMITGGKSKNNTISKYTWVIKNIGVDQINYSRSSKDYTVRYDDDVTTFIYDNQIYMIASDSIYTSTGLGDIWSKGNKKLQFDSRIVNEEKQMRAPSVVVDKDDYIWVFGGRSNGKYLKEVWKGRLNKVAYLHN